MLKFANFDYLGSGKYFSLKKSGFLIKKFCFGLYNPEICDKFKLFVFDFVSAKFLKVTTSIFVPHFDK